MDGKIDLDALSSNNVTESQTQVFNIIKTCLNGEDEMKVRAAKLSNDLRGYGASKKSGEDISTFLWDLWMIVVDIAYLTPPDHPWQDILIYAVQSLHQKGGRVGGVEDDEGLEWKDLPHLAAYMLDKWFDPTELDEWTPEYVSKWKNLNTFAARLTTRTFAPWLTFPIWQLRSALEENLDRGPVLECRVWVATEWILRCGEIVFEDMASKEPFDQNTANTLATGPLCPEIAPRSVERLKFWNRRLAKIADEHRRLGLEPALVSRAHEATMVINRWMMPSVEHEVFDSRITSDSNF